MKTEIGICGANRQAVSLALEKVLADETVLHIKTKNAHWNLEGADFYSKHLLFKSQIWELDVLIDSLAERIRTLVHYATATMKSYLNLTHLSEARSEKNDGDGFIKELLSDHKSIIIHLREHIKAFSSKFHDAGSSDLITGIMKTHEKMAWTLRSHLKTI